MVPHSWILKCLEMVGAAKNIISTISNSMVNWKTVLTSGGTVLGQVDIKRGIFQGDSLSPLLFIVIMLPLSLVLRKMTAGYRLAKDVTPINHLLFMDDLKLYGANKDQLDSLIQVVRIFSQDIKMLLGGRCGIKGRRQTYLISPEEILKKYVNLNLISAPSAENGRSCNGRGLHRFYRFDDYLTQETMTNYRFSNG